MSESSLILPGQETPGVDSMMAHLPEVVWLRNPATGVIYKYLKSKQADNILHALKGETGEGGRQPYTLSSEDAAKAQAIELAQLQGRALPAWATEPKQPEPVMPPTNKTGK